MGFPLIKINSLPILSRPTIWSIPWSRPFFVSDILPFAPPEITAMFLLDSINIPIKASLFVTGYGIPPVPERGDSRLLNLGALIAITKVSNWFSEITMSFIAPEESYTSVIPSISAYPSNELLFMSLKVTVVTPASVDITDAKDR